jgi:hypothetical protein
MDFLIRPTRTPQENNAPAPSARNRSKASAIDSMVGKPGWAGIERRRNPDRRRTRKGQASLVELRQRFDRRRKASISIKV